MPITAHLLGPPLMVRDGAVYAPPKGKKVWALLAYLALSERPPTRQQLIELLFPDAEDPAGALRWNLSELRRLLGGSETVGSGNVVQLRMPEGSMIDVHVLIAGTSLEAVELPGLGRELLEGIEVEASAGFSAWLLGERRRLQALAEGVLREGALRSLAAGNPRRAIELATRLIAADPLNEDAHILLIRSFAGTGDDVAVQRQLAASRDLFRRELGVEPGPGLTEAARVEPRLVSPPRRRGRAALEALLESGNAAVSAGAVDAGIAGLRDVATDARESGDRWIEAAAELALGSALVHATRGRDEEGAASLHRAIASAVVTGQRPVAALAHVELGFVEVLRGDYARARAWLREAEELADAEPSALARIRGLEGACFADVGAHARAERAFAESLRLAEATGQAKQSAWSLAVLGRSRLLRAELETAEEVLQQALEVTRAERWTAFLPFPEAMVAEVWFRRGDLDRATEAFEHAFALACQLEDACWEAYAVRGFGLLRAAQGDLVGAAERFREALTTCARQRDTHLWVRAYTLDALCAVTVASDDPEAGRWVTDLASVAGRSGMQGLCVRSYLHRRDLGDPSAIEAARVLVAGLENPHLHELVQGEVPPLLEDLLGKSDGR